MSHDEKFDQYLEKRAEELGLPTDPAAYQDGGIAVAATAYNVQEADFLAAMLSGNGIPAWVEGGSMSSWYWHMQFAMHPGGIRILVPMGRLAEAQALLAENKPAAKDPTSPGLDQPQAEATEPTEPEDPAYPLYRRARGLAYLLFIGLLYPVIFILALVLLFRVRQQKAKTGSTPYLVKAWRIAAITFLYLSLLATLIGVVVVVSLLREENDDEQMYYRGHPVYLEVPASEPNSPPAEELPMPADKRP